MLHVLALLFYFSFSSSLRSKRVPLSLLPFLFVLCMFISFLYLCFYIVQAELSSFSDAAEPNLRFLAMLAGPFYPILYVVNERYFQLLRNKNCSAMHFSFCLSIYMHAVLSRLIPCNIGLKNFGFQA